MNNVPDPLLSGKELPTFKFALEKSEGKVIGKSYGKEATVTQLPISKGMAGVSMRLEPGAMRELHWHATAAEWAFVIEGRVRTTVIDPEGYAETNDFDPGDVW
jgi:oxalate decarboxylase